MAQHARWTSRLSRVVALVALILYANYTLNRLPTEASIDGAETALRKTRFSGGTAVAILISSLENDVHNSIMAIRSFDDNVLDNRSTPFLLFNEGDLTSAQKGRITNSTEREVLFPYVNFSTYPVGFDPVKEAAPGFRKRSDWGYQQMCRFWLTRLWTHDILEQRGFSTVMRMDADSCFWNRTVADAIPRLSSDEIVYRANTIRTGGYTKGLWELTEEYVKKENLIPKNPELWNQAEETSRQDGALPMFFNNFEIARVSFFARKDVMEYQHKVAEEEPFGVFRQRWGDAPVRFLTLAIFAEPAQIDMKPPLEYAHGSPRRMNRGCPGLQFVRASHA